MTKVLAREMAPRGTTCNIIAPAMMETEASAELSKSPTWKDDMLALQTFPRIIKMDEVCHAADFFVSDKAASITGQVIYIGLVD
jgi:3-oxoacyl-[acyl-carrier protein] reductase